MTAIMRNAAVHAGGAGGGRRRRQAAEHRAVDPAGGRRHRHGADSRPAESDAGAGSRAAGDPAAADLFGRRRHELARLPLQSAADRAARLRLRGLHHLRGGGGGALSAGFRLGGRLPARRHHFADRRGGAAGHRAPARIAAPDRGGAGGRRPRQRRHRAGALSLRRRRRQHRHVLARTRPPAPLC